MSSECDSWMSRQQLELLGVNKLVNEMDSKEAARLGLMTRPLTTAAIEKHLDDFGLEPEFSTHSLMKGLSGGQKVKVVLAAAMWNNPHILVMDEPTNFLDRDSLGALAMVRAPPAARVLPVRAAVAQRAPLLHVCPRNVLWLRAVLVQWLHC
jgi:elongation factor 3